MHVHICGARGREKASSTSGRSTLSEIDTAGEMRRGEKTSFFTYLQIVIQLAFYLNNISGIKVFNVAIIEIKIVLSQTHK